MAILPYETPRQRTDSKGRLLAFIVAIVLATPIWAIWYPGVISELPRPMQGESVSIPFIACVIPYIAVPALLPAAILRGRWARITCAICLFALTLGWYFGLGFDALLSKAWRRGL